MNNYWELSMLFKQENCVWVNNQWIPSAIYGPLKRFDSLNHDAKTLLAWLRERQKQIITIVEMQKCAPIHLRKVDTIRQLMNQLIKFGFVERVTGIAIYSGRKRKEIFRLTRQG